MKAGGQKASGPDHNKPVPGLSSSSALAVPVGLRKPRDESDRCPGLPTTRPAQWALPSGCCPLLPVCPLLPLSQRCLDLDVSPSTNETQQAATRGPTEHGGHRSSRCVWGTGYLTRSLSPLLSRGQEGACSTWSRRLKVKVRKAWSEFGKTGYMQEAHRRSSGAPGLALNEECRCPRGHRARERSPREDPGAGADDAVPTDPS